MRCTRNIILVYAAACLLAACGTARVPETTLTDISKTPFISVDPRQPDGYENLPVFRAEDIFSSRVINGHHYDIDSRILNNGYNNIYRVISDYGFHEAQGTHELRRLLREIKAITIMRQIASSREFKEAFKDSAKAPFLAAKNMAINPLKTLVNIPLGAVKFTKRLGSLVIEDRSNFEESRTKELVGFSDIKRQYAYHLGVDVFSDNEQLQDHLNHISWITFSGHIPMRVAYAFVPNPGGLAISGSTVSGDLNRIMLETTPEDLRFMNRQKLSDMGLTIEPINAFLGSGWLSPRHQTAIMMALEDMQDASGIEGIVKLASASPDERSSFFIQHITQLLARYHKEDEPFKVLHSWNDLILGQTRSDTLVLALPADYLSWSKHMADSITSIDSRIAHPLNITSKKLLVTGTLSARATKELNARGWQTVPNAEKDRPIRL